MSASATDPAPRLVRALPGRLRVHLPRWDGEAAYEIERTLTALNGVNSVTARCSTQNVLIEFDEARIDEGAVLAAVARSGSAAARGPGAAPATPDSAAAADEQASTAAGQGAGASSPNPVRAISGVLRDQAGRFGRARIAVRGIDRDPQLARRVVTILERRPEVKRAVASATTGRVLVEFSGRVSSIQDLLSELSSLELPDTPGEDRPAHPLDPAPIIQSGARVIGSALGLSLIILQRIASGGEGAGATAPAAVAGALGIIDGAPPLRDGLRRVMGRDRAQLVLGGAAVVSMTLSGSPVGLLVSGAGALRLFTEARLRRDAWQDYEQRLENVTDAQPGAVVRLDAGSRVPLPARVVEGAGTVIGGDGLPDPALPGSELDAGASVLRGPLVVELLAGRAWAPGPRPPTPPSLVDRYVALLGPASLAYAALYALRRNSLAAAFTGLLLVNPRAAVVGVEAADTGASARVLRAGVTVVGTRPDRLIRRPDVLVIDGPRVLADGLEQARVIPVGGRERAEVSEIVSALAAASGSPWGSGHQRFRDLQVQDPEFDGNGVSAAVAGRRLRLQAATEEDRDAPEVSRAIEAGEQALVLREVLTGETIAYVHLRPRLAPGVEELRRRCQQAGAEIAVLEAGDRRASRMLTRRAEVPLVLEADLVEFVRTRQRQGQRVAVLSDTPAAAEAFEACDLAIALSSGRSSHFQARADLLAPGLQAVGSIIEAGRRREAAVTGSVVMSVAANLAGAGWGLQAQPGLVRASHATYGGALGAIAFGWERLRGGRRSRSVISRLTDPRPERWGAMDAQEVLQATESRARGLTEEEAQTRQATRVERGSRNAFVAAMGEQLESPLVAILGAGAAVSLAVGAVADVAIIGAVIVANAAVGAWQERQAGQAAQALERIGAASAQVIRAGAVREVPADQVVRGDILLLRSGDRIVADARLLEADALEVDEASLTGESQPVVKAPEAEQVQERIVLEGSDVTVGTGKAVVVAVGEGTRLGATAAALAVEDTRSSALGERLDRLFRQGMPIVVAGGVLVTVAGIAWGGAPLTQLALGASVAVAAVPEGLPLLAGVAEASVARRLTERSAFVRRLTSVEALGRVDVVCCDKTGTLTQGRLALTLVDDLASSAELDGMRTPGRTREVLLCAALACPPPATPEAAAHPTDGAVLAAASRLGLDEQLSEPRIKEAPFDPVRGLHVSGFVQRVCVKGAVEVLVPRCSHAIGPDGSAYELDKRGRAALMARATELASRGLRVLMVADGPAQTTVEDPQDLTARGFVGISDPPRPGAADALNRCRAAGIRVIMLTGDHPATARKIASELGLAASPETVLTGEEIEDVEADVLRQRLAQASVVARITPIDKLRIIESLRESGHTVAMTGDGVNDAPALRLADVGVAMGLGGTEVARQAADLVLADDRFETLTEALLEGRSLWQNLHRALALLLGGNLGEVAMMAGAAVVGRGAVLGARQILAINLVTDVLPAVAVAVQPPRERDLHSVVREGAESFDQRLLSGIVRRGAATAVPSLAAVLAAPLLGAQAPVVAFGSIILTQLAQTLQSGGVDERSSRSVTMAVAGSGGVLGLSLALAPLRRFLALPAPSPQSLLLVAATVPGALVLARVLPNGSALEEHSGRRIAIALDAPQQQQQIGQELVHAEPSTGSMD